MQKHFIMMKPLKMSVLARGAMILLLLYGCGGDSNSDNCPVPDNGKTVISSRLIEYKRDYKVGETFSTAGDTLDVIYSDLTPELISCGFTQEWSASEDYNNAVYASIKHGDPLPIQPCPPSMGLARFWVRAVYKGVAGQHSYRTVGY